MPGSMAPFGRRVILESRTDKSTEIKQATLSPADPSSTAEKKKIILLVKFCYRHTSETSSTSVNTVGCLNSSAI